MSRVTRLLGLIVLCCALAARSNAATIYDAVNDWNSASNTTANTWQYGTTTSLGGTLTELPNHGTNPSPSYDWWSASSIFEGPAVAHNSSGGTVTIPGLNGDPTAQSWPKGELNVQPGGTDNGTAQYTVVRWVSPASGLYTLTGKFTDLQRASVNVYVLSGGSTLFTSSYSGATSYQGDKPFSIIDRFVPQGTAVDFVVFSGGIQADDPTGLAVQIVPEPSCVGLMLVGSATLLFRRRSASRARRRVQMEDSKSKAAGRAGCTSRRL